MITKTVTIETLDGRIVQGMIEKEGLFCKEGTKEDICIPKRNVKNSWEE